MKTKNDKEVHSSENFNLKQRVAWENYYDETLTKDDIIIFLDQNKKNCSIDNLMKISRSDLARLNQSALMTEYPELNVQVVNLAKLKAEIGRSERKLNS